MFESKLNRGKANGYAPLDSSGKVPSDKLPPIQSTINTGSFATTGSNTFVGDQTISGSITTTTGIVQGTGSLYLQPDSNDARYFQIYNTSPSDTHIKASGGLSFFGDDTNYLKIDDSAGDVTIAAFSDIILTSDDGGVYIGSYGSGNGVLTNGYLNTIIGDTDIINSGTGNSITDVIGRIPTVDTGSFATTSSLQTLIDTTGSFATTGSNSFRGNQSITGSLSVAGPLTVSISNGVPSGVSNWEGGGGWNQGFYSDITASGGTGTGLTVDVAAGGSGYIDINAISISTPGSGYTSGDVVTITNENNIPGTFTIIVSSTNPLQCDVNGNLILKSNNAPANLSGSIGDVEGTLRIGQNSIYFASQSFVPETYQITVNPGTTYNTHVSIPINQPGIPNLYSNGFTITTQDDTTYTLTGVYTEGDNWDCEIDSLNSNYNGGTQTMTLTWLDWEPITVWKKTDFGFETGKFVENTTTGSYATTGSNTFVGDQTISGSLFISGTTEFGGDLVPKTARGATLGTNERPFREVYVQSGSINIASDISGDPNTTLSNIGGNILVSAGGMRLVGDASFIAATGSFGYISGSMTQVGDYNQTGDYTMVGDKTITGSLNISGSIILENGSVTASEVLTDLVRFNTSAGVSVGVGELAWNNSDGTLDLGMKGGNVVQQIGQELFYEVRNETGTQIPNGTAVYANGVTAGSGRITAAPYVADGSVRENRFLGLATENISNGVNGFVTHFGYVRGLDTRGTSSSSISVGDETWAVGDILYLHPTVAGKLTNVKPQHEITVAIIITRHQSSGVLFVRPSNAGHLEDIHDINITTASLATGQMLVYNSGTDYWENTNSLSGSYQLTGSLNITGSATLNESNIVSSNTIMKIETISSASYAALTPPVSGTLYIII